MKLLLHKFIPKISKHGINIILFSSCISFLSGIISKYCTFLGSCLVLFLLYFFRDPERYTPPNDKLVFSPADGVITSIKEVNIPSFGKIFNMNKKAIKISIFLNIFNVHINRSPISGYVKYIIYRPGKFVCALKEKESDFNESNSIIIEDNKKNIFIVTQIAGFIARRIKCDISTGAFLNAGERFGIIKFGSRVNIFIPSEYKILVNLNQKVIGGETILASI